MVLIVGLGNPGRRYEGNRHNVGFMLVDELRRDADLPAFRDKFSGEFTRGDRRGHDVALLKPQTFMNLSGDSVQPAAAFLKVPPSQVVVVHDELDIPFGEVRVKVGGGHAGHNGLRSILNRLGTPEFVRVRIGIGRPPATFAGAVADFVLQDFSAEERAALGDVLSRAKAALDRVIELGPAAAMTEANARRKPR
jgi:PTH1 family peptidyl-tRNA hydrolase